MKLEKSFSVKVGIFILVLFSLFFSSGSFAQETPDNVTETQATDSASSPSLENKEPAENTENAAASESDEKESANSPVVDIEILVAEAEENLLGGRFEKVVELAEKQPDSIASSTKFRELYLRALLQQPIPAWITVRTQADALKSVDDKNSWANYALGRYYSEGTKKIDLGRAIKYFTEARNSKNPPPDLSEKYYKTLLRKYWPGILGGTALLIIVLIKLREKILASKKAKIQPEISPESFEGNDIPLAVENPELVEEKPLTPEKQDSVDAKNSAELREAAEIEEAKKAKEAEVSRKLKELKEAEEARKAKQAREAEDTKKAEEAKKAEEIKKAKEAEEARKAKAAQEGEEAKKTKELKEAEDARKAKLAQENEDARKAKEIKEAEEAGKAKQAQETEEAKKAKVIVPEAAKTAKEIKDVQPEIKQAKVTPVTDAEMTNQKKDVISASFSTFSDDSFIGIKDEAGTKKETESLQWSSRQSFDVKNYTCKKAEEKFALPESPGYESLNSPESEQIEKRWQQLIEKFSKSPIKIYSRKEGNSGQSDKKSQVKTLSSKIGDDVISLDLSDSNLSEDLVAKIKMLSITDDELMKLLEEKNPCHLPLFVEFLATRPDPKRTALLAAGLGNYHDPGVTDVLVSLLRNENKGVVYAAIGGLQTNGDPAGILSICHLLRSEDHELASAARAALYSFGPAKILEALANLHENPDEQIKASAVFLLARMKGKPVRAILEKMLYDTSEKVRKEVIEGMTFQKDPFYIDCLREFVKNSASEEKKLARKAMIYLQGFTPKPHAAA
ncbi:MAG: HEAT repeat domain-containing protein [Candidatus Riflebacteria bacterium]|nr:HEAT repeat domain-containing protein [Candidatus Riflebacteria bacterium]